METFEVRAERVLRLNNPDETDEQIEARLASLLRAREFYAKRSGKTCHRCEEFKALTEYGTDSREDDALRDICKECLA